MREGLLWYEDNPRKQLDEIVRQAARHYKHKHGHSPDLCFVHPTALGDNGNGKVNRVGQVEIRTRRSVLRHHFWIGIKKSVNPADPCSEVKQ